MKHFILRPPFICPRKSGQQKNCYLSRRNKTLKFYFTKTEAPFL